MLFKATALPEEYATAHPKRLRFAIFTQLGRVINHAGQMLLRVSTRTGEMLMRPAYHEVSSKGVEIVSGSEYPFR